MSAQERVGAVQLLLAVAGGIGTIAVIVFWPAGTLDWPAGWAYLGIITAYYGISVVYLNRVNPELIVHRMRYGAGTKRWDVVWLIVFSPLFIGVYVVAGLDAVRYEWSLMPGWLWPLGLALFVSGAWLFTWSMGVNPYFEKTVRIQTERGHRVIDTGPYAHVRHPGYVGLFGWTLGTPVLLGSWCALGPAVLASIAVIVRTALEDRTLRAELHGYEAYAARVRYRLVPGIW